MEKKKGINIKDCAYKVVIDSREKSIKHILNGFDKGFEDTGHAVAWAFAELQ